MSRPSIDEIEDSIRKKTSLFVTSQNGYIRSYKNGKLIQKYNYGNLILNDSTRNFDLLNPGLYKLVNNNLVVISNDADSLFKQKEGIYFVPSPGYGIIKMINKKFILNYIDSVFTSGKIPDKIIFRAN